MKKKKDISGLIFSAFLVIAYVICSYFFIGIISDSTGLDANLKLLLKSAVFVIFGLILFYATRVGDGKQVKRFSFSALLLVDLPSIYIILAACFTMLPFPLDLSNAAEMVSIAAVALGYGIPYTFLSGYELDIPEDEKADNNEAKGTQKTEDSLNSKDVQTKETEQEDNADYDSENDKNEMTETDTDETEKDNS